MFLSNTKSSESAKRSNSVSCPPLTGVIVNTQQGVMRSKQAREGKVNDARYLDADLITDGEIWVVSHVYETTDYSKFVTFPCNREPDHYKRIAKSMEKEVDIQNPIKVTKHPDFPGKLVIVDGNNSFHARMSKNLPVPFVVLKNATEKDMKVANRNSKVWGLWDYIKSNAAQGDPGCIALKEWAETYSDVPKQSVIHILQGSLTHKSHKDAKDPLKDGGFEIPDMQKSQKIMDFLMRLKKMEESWGVREGATVYNHDKFVNSIIKFFQNDDFDSEFLLKQISYKKKKDDESPKDMYLSLRGCSNKNLISEKICALYNKPVGGRGQSSAHVLYVDKNTGSIYSSRRES